MRSVRHSLVRFFYYNLRLWSRADPEKRKAACRTASRIQYRANPDKKKAASRANYQTNQEAASRADYQANPNKKGAASRAHYQAYSHRKKAVVKVTDHYQNSA